VAEMKKKLQAWSYSLYTTWKECPRKARYRAIDRVKTPAKPKPALERGIHIHKLAERYLLGDITGIPKELKFFDKEFRNLKKANPDPEKDVAVTRSWSPTTFDDWNNVWCRAKLDAVVQDGKALHLIDFKTGRMYGTNKDQIELYVPLAAAHYPDVETIEVELWYLDQDDMPPPVEYTKKSFPAIRKAWEKRVKPMMNDTEFPATPSEQACKWCPYKTSEGGPCEEWMKS